MSVVINTNNAASLASYNLGQTNDRLQQSLNRLSSGSRINSSYDDAGGLAVSMKLSAALRRSQACEAGVGNALAFLQTQDGAMQNVTKILTRISELSALGLDISKNTSDITNYFIEIKNLYSEIANISQEKFNGISLFDNQASSASSFSAVEFLNVVTSEDGTQTSSISIPPLPAINLWTTFVPGVFTDPDNDNDFPGEDIDTEIQHALDEGYSWHFIMQSFLDNSAITLQVLADWRAQNGAEQSRLEFAKDILAVNQVNLEQANSRIMDVDVASESTQLTRFNILQQAGTAMLTQANQSTQSILRLISLN